MRDQKEDSHDLEQLSRELVRYFLSIHGYGVILPKRILLYGCPHEVMTLMANVMKEELTDITISILGRSCAPSINGEGYYIDVAYFIGRACRAEPPSIDEETSQRLTLSDADESGTFSLDMHRTDRFGTEKVLTSNGSQIEGRGKK